MQEKGDLLSMPQVLLSFQHWVTDNMVCDLWPKLTARVFRTTDH